jgi:hypothetical protein
LYVSAFGLLQLFTKTVERYSYRSLEDNILFENDECLKWIKNWEKTVTATEDISKKEKEKRFLANQAKFDLSSMILGFKAFCQNMFQDFPGCGVTTARTNQDV